MHSTHCVCVWYRCESFSTSKLHRRPVELWLDKACIDQSRISDSLACLPVYLAGCTRLLVVAGPTYVSRLWCAMEIFTFLIMGGHASRIVLLPIAKDDESAAPTPSEAMGFFSNFDVRNAYCFQPEDRQRLLGVIEAGYGGYDGFNQQVCETFRHKVATSPSGKRLVMPLTDDIHRGSRVFERATSVEFDVGDLAVDSLASVFGGVANLVEGVVGSEVLSPRTSRARSTPEA